MNFSLNDICQITGGTCNGNSTATRFIFDSRTCCKTEGTMFCALTTPAADGHKYIEDAYNDGVRLFLVEKVPNKIFSNAKFVVVKSVYEAIDLLAKSARSRLADKKVVGITGSRGKTVVKELLYTLLNKCGAKVWRSPRSWNSRLGVPMSLINAPENCDIYIFEAGIDSPGVMATLATLIQPTLGILTSITDAHDRGFKSRTSKIIEKSKLFAGCNEIIVEGSEPEAVAIIRQNFTGSKIVEVEGNTPESRNIAVAIASAKALGYDKVESYDLAQPDNRIDVFDGINNCLVLHDRFTPDMQSLEAALDFMNRRKTATRTNTLITTPELASELKTSKNSDSFGISKIIAADSTFFANYDSADFQNETILIAGGTSQLFDEIKNTVEKPRHDTVFEINLNSIVHNLNYYRSLIAHDTGVVGMVKAQAYGTGALEVAKTLQAQGVDYLAVAVIDEGVALRRGGITMPIMVLNPVTDNYGAMFRHNLEPSIFSIGELRLLTEKARQYGIKSFNAHIKLDTGMHRVGFTPEEVGTLINELHELPEVHIASIFSHLATADCPDQENYTHEQLKIFAEQSSRIIHELPYPAKRHILNTAGIQTHPEHQYDMVRIGIGLYGVSPVNICPGTLATVASLKSTIISVKKWSAGTTIGYGRRGVLNRDSVIATVAIGYADGVNRHLGRGNASFIVNGVKCPTVGNICMDQLMIDVTDVPDAQVGDKVEIYGQQQPVEHLAEILDTIPYELIATVSPRVARIYYNND